jgi:hypothetical protein
MKKKARAKNVKTGAKAKKGEKYVCDACGMVITVDKACGCDPCGITCCGQDMSPLSCC